MTALRFLPLAMALIGCSGGDDRAPPAASAGGSNSSGGTGPAPSGGRVNAQGGGTLGGSTSGGQTSASGGEGTLMPGPDCGNDQIDADEECDGPALFMNCEAIGAGVGELACDATCRFDTSACDTAERCANGLDEDADGLRDCEDPDCEAACEDPCHNPEVLEEAVVQRVLASGSRFAGALSCGSEDEPPQVVYQLFPTSSGVLEVTVQGGPPSFLSVRTSCSAARTELACSLDQAQAQATRGEPIYVIVESIPGESPMPLELLATVRPENVCGDGVRDPEEACDDADLESGDGCDGECRLEATEQEENGTLAEASDFSDPYFGEINPQGDVDVVRVSVTLPATTLTAATLNFGDGACAKNQLDSVLELLDPQGSVLASDDDGGDGLCALLIARDLAPGEYYLRIQAAEGALPETFPYRLYVTQSQTSQ